MGCISSKKAGSESPPFGARSSSGRRSSSSNGQGRLTSGSLLAVGPLEKIKEEPEKEAGVEDENEDSVKKRSRSGNLRALKRGSSHKRSVFSFKFGRLTEGEHVAAGWPAWLSAVAGEAIEGWVPLRSDSFERLEKIGQGTYSDVYRARQLETGKIFAVKKVRFDNFQPESVRFMAREILILRRLDHPNIMKLEGIITSRLSCHIYLVFEYMEHDLAGLLSCPDIKFTDSQIKCYMRQLLSGVEHCHSRGVLHRDIKTSNILVNNEGVLKIADFGLANFIKTKNKQPLTSRVVTLWYRPPELLLGSTSYGEAVDLWSVGCVFAELFIGRPILKGRTEVEQLHKIFKLCGSPPEDYWKRSKLPLANMFKPQHPYESTLRERCKEFPKSAVSLIETFLSIEPYNRGTAASALDSKEEGFRSTDTRKFKKSKESPKTLQESTEFFKVVPKEVLSLSLSLTLSDQSMGKILTLPMSRFCFLKEAEGKQLVSRRSHGGSTNAYRRRSGLASRTSLKQSYDTVSEASQLTQESQGSNVSTTRSVPVEASGSNGSAWAKRQMQKEAYTRLHGPHTSRGQKYNALEPPNVLHATESSDSDEHEIDDPSGGVQRNQAPKRTVRWEADRVHEPEDSFHPTDIYEPHDLYMDNGNKKKKGRVVFSGPLIYQSEESTSGQHDELRQPLNRSRFAKGNNE
ncbi:UNVERIFIED_CONTAM: protein IMPAIRED IN BABA-INDUCED STERILITY 1 [Sesamum radiatum]|uniref:[RNA-polymerase]-subunit kinase n=1 Tax=Sesamum radiatum TaxID=300843 RepID=A0AAW2VUK2_SESRA